MTRITAVLTFTVFLLAVGCVQEKSSSTPEGSQPSVSGTVEGSAPSPTATFPPATSVSSAVEESAPTPTATFTSAATATVIGALTPSPVPTATSAPTATPTVVETPTPSPIPTATLTPTPSPAPTATLTPTPSPVPTATPTPTPSPQPTPTVSPVEFRFEGTGSKVLGPVDLSPGVLTLIATHSGSRNFVVWVVGLDSEELSINEIGNYSGAVAHRVEAGGIFSLEPGPVRIQVEADGDWSITLNQQFPSAGATPPQTLSGNGSDVIKWLLFREGQYVLTAEHSGSRNFIVRLLKSDGTEEDLVINQIGSYSGEHLLDVREGIFTLPPGLYALVVEADGSWEVSIE